MDYELKEFILTYQNLAKFERWAATCSVDDLFEALNTVYFIKHKVPDWLEDMCPHLPVIIDREDLGYRFRLMEQDCSDPNCNRCYVRGGFAFKWVGPWSCPCIVGDETTSPQDLVQQWLNCPRCRPRGSATDWMSRNAADI